MIYPAEQIEQGIYDIKGFPLFTLFAGLLFGFLLVNWIFALVSCATFIWLTLWMQRPKKTEE